MHARVVSIKTVFRHIDIHSSSVYIYDKSKFSYAST